MLTESQRQEAANLNARLKELVIQKLPEPGDYPTGIGGVTLLRREAASYSTRCYEQPLAAFILQGSKKSFFGAHSYDYWEGQCLVAGIGMPASYQTLPATQQKPFLSLFFYLDTDLIKELSLSMPKSSIQTEEYCGVTISETPPRLLEAMLRLLRLLDEPEHLPVLAPMLMRELHYYLLTGPYGRLLRQLIAQKGQSQAVAQVMDWLHDNLATDLSVHAIARRAGVSEATLHRYFKRFSGLSPMQYVKQLRLCEAQRLMLAEHERAANAAWAVGYESVSQFNRDYKRLFGAPPHRDVKQKQEGNV